MGAAARRTFPRCASILEVHDIDPNNPPSIVAASTVLFDGSLPAAPDYCTYALHG